MKKLFFPVFIFLLAFNTYAAEKPIRLMIITGGHNYNKVTFNEMLSSLGRNISYEIVEFPKAYDMFLPDNQDKYDIIVFYHMWQNISEVQKKTFSDCIAKGKPLVLLHHSICAFDNWEEYYRIVGGKYFHKPTTFEGYDYKASSYKHDLKFMVRVAAKNHPVTKGVTDFEIFDETYDDYYVAPKVKPLLTTEEPTSTPVIGWSHKYGKARVVTLQSGHDSPTFQHESYRKLLRQAIQWVYSGK